jgi:hypothetical protein
MLRLAVHALERILCMLWIADCTSRRLRFGCYAADGGVPAADGIKPSTQQDMVKYLGEAVELIEDIDSININAEYSFVAR